MKNKTIKVGLAGNPNVGKSTLFNALTGMNQHTGNWPGKTVESAVGEFQIDETKVSMYDLPRYIFFNITFKGRRSNKRFYLPRRLRRNNCCVRCSMLGKKLAISFTSIRNY